jgi:hypothetical protein
VKGRESKTALTSVSSDKLVEAINDKRNLPRTTLLEGYDKISDLLKSKKNSSAIVFLSAGPLDDYVRNEILQKDENDSCE